MSSPLAPIYSSGQRYSRTDQDSVASVDVELSRASYLLEMIGALPIRLSSAIASTANRATSRRLIRMLAGFRDIAHLYLLGAGAAGCSEEQDRGPRFVSDVASRSAGA